MDRKLWAFALVVLLCAGYAVVVDPIVKREDVVVAAELNNHYNKDDQVQVSMVGPIQLHGDIFNGLHILAKLDDQWVKIKIFNANKTFFWPWSFFFWRFWSTHTYT